MPIGKEIRQNIIKSAKKSKARHEKFKESLNSFYLNNKEEEYQKLQEEFKKLLKGSEEDLADKYPSP
ncbi:hypothetical protein [Terribacillus halophilus]|uniref:hypothetical protein n=1 Tax=Terribacillus halophilus TaxID=361279 RepID=UPI00098555F1|nr:hypothetical protein [Terribacillus halophilus]